MAAVETTAPSISPAAEANFCKTTFAGERYPQTRTRLIGEDEAARMSFAQLRYALNEVYARYGAAFASKPELQKQFGQFDWYKPRDIPISAIEEQLTATERANIETLAKHRNLKK